MGEYIIFVYLIGLALFGALTTFLLDKFFKKNFVKFIPSILTFGFAMFYVVNIYFFELEGMLELAYFLMLLLVASMFLGSLLMALYLHYKK
jgi:hypothetical protein